MDKKEILKALQAQVAQIQQELDNEEAPAVEKYPAMLSSEGIYFLGSDNYNVVHMIWLDEGDTLSAKDDINVFPDEATAQGYAEAFKVMLELRRCEGAGHFCDNVCLEDQGWPLDIYNGGVEQYCVDSPEMFTLFPPFPNKELAQAAMNKVGKDRIIAAAKFLANMKG